MDVASGRVDEEEDLAGGLEGDFADRHVPVVGHEAGWGELVAREGVKG